MHSLRVGFRAADKEVTDNLDVMHSCLDKSQVEITEYSSDK